MSWTDERVEELEKLWLEGLSASQIARIIGGVTRNAVIGKVHRIGLAGRAQRSRSRDFLGGMAKPTRDIRKMTKARLAPPQRPSRTERVKPGIRDILRDLPSEPPPPVDTMPAQVSFNGLEAHHCRAIVAEHLPFDADRKIYCGERKEPGKVYCPCHVRRYENTIPATAATRAVVQGVYRAPGKNFGVGHTARVNEFLTETT